MDRTLMMRAMRAMLGAVLIVIFCAPGDVAQGQILSQLWQGSAIAGPPLTLVASCSGGTGPSSCNVNVSANQLYILVCISNPGCCGGTGQVIFHFNIAGVWWVGTGPNSYQLANKNTVGIAENYWTTSGAVTMSCDGPGSFQGDWTNMSVLTCPTCTLTPGTFFGNSSGTTTVTTLMTTGVSTTGKSYTLACAFQSLASATIAGSPGNLTPVSNCGWANLASAYSGQSVTVNISSADYLPMVGVALYH